MLALIALVLTPWQARVPDAVAVASDPVSSDIVLHDCMLVFRFGDDVRSGVDLHGSEARAINDAGAIVGWSESGDGAIRATLWTGSTSVDLGTLGGRNSCALDINAHGDVVGWAETSSGERRAALWDSAGLHDLGGWPGESSVAFAINDAGQAVGLSWPLFTVLSPPVGRAVLWDGETMTDIGARLDVYGSGGMDINNDGEMVGWLVTHDGRRLAFRWSADGVELLATPRGVKSSANAVNDAGVVAGWHTEAGNDGVRRASVWTDGRTIDLNPALPGDDESRWSNSYDIDESGTVAGAIQTSTGQLVAVVWPSSGAAATALGTLGGDKAEGCAINEAGQVVGWAADEDGVPRAFVWQEGEMTPVGKIRNANAYGDEVSR